MTMTMTTTPMPAGPNDTAVDALAAIVRHAPDRGPIEVALLVAPLGCSLQAERGAPTDLLAHEQRLAAEPPS